jgi:zinc protease
MTNPRASLVVLVCFVGSLQLACARRNPGNASQSPSASPTPNEFELVNQILDRYVEAAGGKEAIEAVKSYRMKGHFEIAALNLSGKIEVWAKDPQRSLTIIEFPGMPPLRKGDDGETHWVQTPVGTFSMEGPQEMSEVERDAEVYSASRIRNLYDQMILERKARLSGRDVYIVEGRPTKGPPEKLFFDVENGLLVRWDTARRQADRRVFVKLHLNDYRDVDGVKVPFNVRLAFESFDFTIIVDEMQHNVEINDAIFRKPK